MTEINCPNSKTKCPLQNNSIIMTTYDFSMKSVRGGLKKKLDKIKTLAEGPNREKSLCE